MASKHFKAKKKPPSPAQQFEVFRAEVLKSQQKIADRHVTRRGPVLQANKRGRFKFAGETVVKGTHILTQVTLENEGESLGRYGGTVGALWGWINRGTKPHVILPRFKRALAFVVGGAAVVVRRVRHPGTKARNHTKRINESMEPFRIKETARGFRDAWIKLEKFNKRKR